MSAHRRLSPTLFSHLSYGVAEQYPDGVADIVGYWAENRVLGGVVIFDRSDSWDDKHKPEPNVYLHSDYQFVTFRIWRALDEQQQSLVDFLLSRSKASPFPLTASSKNLDRVDPLNATYRKVYRDIWEREPPGDKTPHCVRNVIDYPEIALVRERVSRLTTEKVSYRELERLQNEFRQYHR